MSKKTYTTVILFFASIHLFAQGIVIPSGYGAWGNMVFAAAGGNNYYKADSDKKLWDAAGAFGYGFGDPAQSIGIEFTTNLVSVTKFDFFPINLKIHRYLGYGLSASTGFESFNVIGISKPASNDLTSIYFSLSADLKYVTEGFPSRMSFVIGGGRGRFTENGGTGVYAGMQIKALKWVNLNADWSGQYASAGISFVAKIKNVRASFMVAGLDIANSDPNLIQIGFSGGIGYQFPQHRQRPRPGMTPQADVQATAIQEAEISQLKELNRQKDRQYLDLLARLERIEATSKGEDPTIVNEVSPDSLSQNVINMSADEIVHVNNRDVSDQKIVIGYYVVLYTFKGRNNTQKALARFKYMGLEPKIAYNKADENYYIYLERINDEMTAVRHRDDLRKRGFDKAWVLFYQ